MAETTSASAGTFGRTVEVALDAPAQVGKYKIVRALGHGASGTVFLAEDTLLARPVALKLLTEKNQPGRRHRERLILEARSATRLNHARSVAVYDINEADGRPFIAMEWMQGGSAQEALEKRGSIPWREATRWMLDACEAIAAAHNAGMLHRDIKPGNILLDEHGRAKIGDFGLVKLTGEEDAMLTATGGPMGTPSFMSPEQCRAEPVDVTSDVYSLGATYFALLAGSPPYKSETSLGVMFAHCSNPIPNLRDLVTDLPDACALIVERAMAKDPGDRHPTAHELARDLAKLLGEAAPALPARQRSSRSFAFVAVAATLLVALRHARLAPTRARASNRATYDPPWSPQSPRQLRKRPPSPILFPSVVQVGNLRGKISDLDFTAQGEIVALSLEGDLATWSRSTDGSFHPQVAEPNGKDAKLYALGYFPKQDLLVIGGDMTDLLLWDRKKQEVIGRFPHQHQRVHSIDVAMDGETFVTGGDIGWHAWNLKPDRTIYDQKPLTEGMVLAHSVSFSPVRMMAAAVSGNGFVALTPFDNPAGSTAENINELVSCAAFGHSRHELLYATQQGKIMHCTCTSRMKNKGELATLDYVPLALDTAPERRVVAAVGDKKGTVLFLDLERGKALKRSIGVQTQLVRVRFSPDGKHLIAGDTSGRLYWVELPLDEFSAPIPKTEAVLDQVSNYIPTAEVHFGERDALRKIFFPPKPEIRAEKKP